MEHVQQGEVRTGCSKESDAVVIGGEGEPAAARPGVGLACNFCRRSHSLCETKRPCARCEKAGRAHLCSDVPLRKRGRPRRTDAANPTPKAPKAKPCQPTSQPLSTAATATTASSNGVVVALAADVGQKLPAHAGLDSLPFLAISPRTPHAHHPPPSSPSPSPSPSSNALLRGALDVVSDELRRTREDNEKLRAKLRKATAKLKHQRAEAKQLRHALEREVEDKARLAIQPRIRATSASMMATTPSSSSSSFSSSSSTLSSLSSPPGMSSSSSSLSPHSPSPSSVSSYSALHASPLAVMRHVHQHMPFLSDYACSPRDFVVQDLRLPFLASIIVDMNPPIIAYASLAFSHLVGIPQSNLVGYPLLQLWAENGGCQVATRVLAEAKPPMYVSEFLSADPVIRSTNGFTIRVSFVLQFFFDNRGKARYAVAAAQSWRVIHPREGESTNPAPEVAGIDGRRVELEVDDHLATGGLPPNLGATTPVSCVDDPYYDEHMLVDDNASPFLLTQT